MKFKFNSQNKDYDVEITQAGGQIKVAVNGKEFLFDSQSQADVAAVPQTQLPRRDMGDKSLRAVLAGTITELSVKVGDIVSPGQKLLTLSAMKMENEILAEAEGKVKEIKIAKNQKVKEGDILMTFI